MTSRNPNGRRSHAGSVLLGLLLASTPLAAQEAITLRVADSFPANHYVYRHATKYWMDQVTELSGGSIKFEYYPAEQLGKARDMLAMIGTGVADVAYVAPSYISDTLPASAVGELPWGYSDPCVGTKAFWNLAKEGGALWENELKALGMRVVFALMLPPNQLVMAAEGFSDFDSLKGRKIRTSGGTKDFIVRQLGATPIQVAAPELHEALARGTIDGLLIPLSSMLPYDLHTISKAATFDENLGGFTITYAISEKRWQELPEAAREALMTAGEQTTERACRKVAEDEEEVRKRVLEAGMVKVEQTSRRFPTFRDRWRSIGQRNSMPAAIPERLYSMHMRRH